MIDLVPVDAERALMRALLQNPKEYAYLLGEINPSHIAHPLLSTAWSAAKRLHESERPISYTTVADASLAGGLTVDKEFLYEVQTEVKALPIDAAKEIVVDRARRRALETALSLSLQQVRDVNVTTDELGLNTTERVQRAVSMTANDVMIPDEWAGRFAEELQNPSEMISTGYPTLDALIGGVRKKELMYIIARSGHGKTSMMLNLAFNMALLQKKRVLYVTIEMGANEIVQRLVSKLTHVLLADIRHNRGGEYVEFALDKLRRNARLLIRDTEPASISSITSNVAALQRRAATAIDALFVDYWQIIDPDPELRGASNSTIGLDHIAKQLHSISKRYDVAVITGCQMNKAASMRDGMPEPTDSRGSEALHFNASKAIGLQLPGTQGQNGEEGMWVNCLKNRSDGGANPDRVVVLGWDGPYTEIYERGAPRIYEAFHKEWQARRGEYEKPQF